MTSANGIDRRSFVAAASAGVAASAMMAQRAHGAADHPHIERLTSRSGVYTPARGNAVMQFSFDFPEPSVRVGDYLFSFRVQTFENAYAIDGDTVMVERDGAKTVVTVGGFLGDGGQTRARGRLAAEFQAHPDGALEWRIKAEHGGDIKSVTTIVRGVPKGMLSVSANAFADYGDDERVFEYPYLFGGMTTPFIIVKSPDGGLTELSARQTEVRPARFFFQPGPDGYRVEMIYESEGWKRSPKIETHLWRIAPAASFDHAAAKHFAHVERTYGAPAIERRSDAPDWVREIGLVLSIHGAHWTGFVFNTYEQSLEILKWAAGQVDPRKALVFLPAWDGRYYWNYPLYKADPRMGGEEGLKRLIAEGQKLGFRMALMFGLNSANKTLPEFSRLQGAVTEHVDGDAFDLDWVDWDNDRRNNGFSPFMNIAVDEWRNWLRDRISDVIATYGPDAYFLDIAGAWINNSKGDMYEGTGKLVADLRKRRPGVVPIAEMVFDAQLAHFPLTQVTRYPAYPAGADRYVRIFQHLSRPAPGRGSTGVHEAGFGVYSPEIDVDQRAIPTLTIVDDTFTDHRDGMAAYIEQAKSVMAARGL